MKVEDNYFASLLETWVLLGTESAKVAAARRRSQDITALQVTLQQYGQTARDDKRVVKLDLEFYMGIVAASGNAVLQSVLSAITPEVVDNLVQVDFYKDRSATSILAEYEVILGHVIAQETKKAGAAMRTHLKAVLAYSRYLKMRSGNGSSNPH